MTALGAGNPVFRSVGIRYVQGTVRGLAAAEAGAASRVRCDGGSSRVRAACRRPSCRPFLLPSPCPSCPLSHVPLWSPPPCSLSLPVLSPWLPHPLGRPPLAPSPFGSSPPGSLS